MAEPRGLVPGSRAGVAPLTAPPAGPNPDNIHIGAARIFLNVTPPATGNPPDLLTHTDGIPDSGIEVGYTQNATTFTYKQIKQEVEAEQSLNPVDVFVTKEEITIEFNAMEHVYSTLKAAFDNVGSVDDAEKTMFYGGDSAGLVSVGTVCCALTSRIRTAPTKFEVLCIYKVYNVEGIVIPYNRTGVAVYKVTLKGLVDSARQAGDRLFQWYREKGGVTATGATAGSPGTFTPAGSDPPMTLGAMGPVIASPLTAWATGEHVILGDQSHAHWNGAAWTTGDATVMTGLSSPGGGGPVSGAPGTGDTVTPAPGRSVPGGSAGSGGGSGSVGGPGGPGSVGGPGR